MRHRPAQREDGRVDPAGGLSGYTPPRTPNWHSRLHPQESPPVVRPGGFRYRGLVVISDWSGTPAGAGWCAERQPSAQPSESRSLREWSETRGLQSGQHLRSETESDAGPDPRSARRAAPPANSARPSAGSFAWSQSAGPWHALRGACGRRWHQSSEPMRPTLTKRSPTPESVRFLVSLSTSSERLKVAKAAVVTRSTPMELSRKLLKVFIVIRG